MTDNDLPKSIVVVLVLLAVSISILGTFTVIGKLNELESAPVYSSSQTSQYAQVKLTVEDPNAVGPTANAMGQVTFRVIDPPGGN